jgi:predicted metal-binding membrane protein
MSVAHVTTTRDTGLIAGRLVARFGEVPAVAWLRARRREEAALLLVAAAAWAGWFAVMVLAGTPGRDIASDGGAHRHASPLLGGPTDATGVNAGGPEPFGSGAFVAIAMWALMVAAMMLPTVLPAARYVAEVSRPALRSRLVATFSVAYLGIWTAVGLLIIATTSWLGAPDRPLLVALVIAAALWELTPLKRRALARCCRTVPIRLRGFAAFRSSAAYGVRNGAVCVLACGPAMAVLALARHPLVATAVVAAVLIGEKVWRRGDRLRPWGAAAGLLLAAAAVVA